MNRPSQELRYFFTAAFGTTNIGGYGFAHGEPGAKKALAGVAGIVDGARAVIGAGELSLRILVAVIAKAGTGVS